MRKRLFFMEEGLLTHRLNQLFNIIDLVQQQLDLWKEMFLKIGQSRGPRIWALVCIF